MQRVGSLVVRSCLIALATIVFGIPFAAAEPPYRPDAPSPVPPCGKAQAMATRFRAEQELQRNPEVERAAREAMAETDVLHYDLDIEVTNLNPSGNTCTITGSNTMTIQSLSDTLDTFTFRLRSNYTITSALINGATPITVNQLDLVTREAQLDRVYTTADAPFTLTILPSCKRYTAAMDMP